LKLKRGDLLWANLGARNGTQPGKVRPVIVIQTDFLNALPHPSTVVVVCTSRLAGENIMRTVIAPGMAGNKLETEVLIDQIRSLDNRSFVKKMGTVPAIVMKEIDEKLGVLLHLGLNLG